MGTSIILRKRRRRRRRMEKRMRKKKIVGWRKWIKNRRGGREG